MQCPRIVPEPTDPGVPTAMRGKVTLSAAHEGNGEGLPCNTTAQVWHRGRDAAALAGLMVVLAALWAAIFFSSTRVWGEYRPIAGELQEPPSPPTILVPTLSLDEAREIIERAAGEGVGAHDTR